jgi:spermidine synthase
MWSFQYGVKGDLNMKQLPNPEAVRAFTEKHNLRYYNEDIHTASFATPGFVKELLK